MNSITATSQVELTYILRYENAQGDIIEEITKDKPMTVHLGQEDLFEKFEEALIGLEVGSNFEVILTPSQSYGDYDEESIVSVPMSELLEDSDPVKLQAGMLIPVVSDEGEEMEAIVLEVDEDIVTLDFNHPLAGETLHFSGKILRIL